MNLKPITKAITPVFVTLVLSVIGVFTTWLVGGTFSVMALRLAIAAFLVSIGQSLAVYYAPANAEVSK